MTPQEYEQLLHDAEVKLARLKALYEQWFQGIERTEPAIARKDLDRTLELLKKSMPRNTALRFRTQQLSARYGTYAIYWGRIGRQIEEGTYKRSLARVNRNAAGAGAKEEREESAWEIEVDVDETESGTAGLDFSEGDLDAILGAFASQEEEKPKTKPTRALSPFGFGAGLAPSKPPAAAGAPAAATFGKPVASAPAPAAPVTGTMARPKDPTPAVAPAVAKPAAVPAAPVRAPAPVPGPAIANPQAPVAPSIPRPAAAPPPPAVAKPAVPPPPSAAAPVSRPGVAPPSAPLPVSRPVAPAPAPSAVRPAAAPPSSGLDETRMRAIHASYVDARRKNNEGADVRYETLAESVQKMMPKLREKHGGKAIDFEVVVQNGKVGLKPKVSG